MKGNTAMTFKQSFLYHLTKWGDNTHLMYYISLVFMIYFMSVEGIISISILALFCILRDAIFNRKSKRDNVYDPLEEAIRDL